VSDRSRRVAPVCLDGVCFSSVSRATIVVLLWGLFGVLTGCGARPGIPIERVRLGEHEITIPGRVDDLGVDLGDAYRVEASVTLPPSMHGEPVDLSIPLLEAPVSIHADGRAVPSDGRSTGYREPGPHRFRIPRSATADGHLELWIDIEHRWAKSGWLSTTPQIVPAGSRDPPAAAAQWLNVFSAWLAMGVLFQVGATCVIVYALDRRRLPYLWFGIQAVFAMTYPAFSSGILVDLLGTAELPILDLGLLTGLLISLRFTHSLFELGPVPRALDAVLAAAALASVVLYDPFMEATIAARTVVGAVAICVNYQLWVIGRVILHRPEDRAGAVLLGGGWLVLGLGTLGDVHSWFLATEMLGGPRPSCLSMAVFALFLSLVLSRSHVTTLAHADELNVALARRIQEVEVERTRTTELNEELRTQISERSANLFAALALVESRGDGRRARITQGMEIDGRYRVEAVLGAGAMGMVYEVVHLVDDSRWAMKVTTEIHGVALARLAREAHIASQLRHEHVVQVRDIGASSLGFMYIVLELVQGRSLGEQLREDGQPTSSTAREILRQVASGLVALHGVGIVHRDLKPDNVLITERGGRLIAKITDFGISRVGRCDEPSSDASVADDSAGGLDIGTVRLDREPPPDPEDSTAPDPVPSDAQTQTHAHHPSDGGRGPARPADLALTGTGFIVGTPRYIAPELARPGTEPDPSADMFSYGVLAAELLTGERPFPEAVAIQLMKGEVVEASPSISAPPELGDVGVLLWRCLSFDPRARPTAPQVADALTGPL